MYIDSPEVVIQRIHDHPEVLGTTVSKSDLLGDAIRVETLIRVESVAITEALLHLGADANEPDRSGQHPLELAKWNPDMVETLLRFGADPNARGGDGERLILSIANQT